jgi:hypothetical protein
LVFSEEIFEEIPNQDARHGTTRFAPYIRDTAFKPGRESKSHSESYEPQEPCDDGSVSAFAKPRVGKGGKRFKVAGRLECRVVQSNLKAMPGMSHGRDIKDLGSVGKERADIVTSGVKLRPECRR